MKSRSNPDRNEPGEERTGSTSVSSKSPLIAKVESVRSGLDSTYWSCQIITVDTVLSVNENIAD